MRGCWLLSPGIMLKFSRQDAQPFDNFSVAISKTLATFENNSTTPVYRGGDDGDGGRGGAGMQFWTPPSPILAAEWERPGDFGYRGNLAQGLASLAPSEAGGREGKASSWPTPKACFSSAPAVNLWEKFLGAGGRLVQTPCQKRIHLPVYSTLLPVSASQSLLHRHIVTSVIGPWLMRYLFRQSEYVMYI